MTKKRIVVIGGGTGSFVILLGLKNYNVNLSAVVSVTDSGGSTGRLRTEFGFLPVGDFRQCLAALAPDNDNYIQRLLLYRFCKGKGICGHNIGNLILTALRDMTGSDPEAIAVASKIFRLKGEVLPITINDIQLVAKYEDENVVIGEHNIDEPPFRGGRKIISLFTKPRAKIYTQAAQAIKEADLIVLSPGDLYTSLIPNLIIDGTREAISNSKGKIIYIINLMTRYSQTHNYSANDHLREVAKYLGRKPDCILINKSKIPEKIIKKYKREKGFPVKDDLMENQGINVIRDNFLSPILINKIPGDSLQRSFLRHDSIKLAKTIFSLL